MRTSYQDFIISDLLCIASVPRTKHTHTYKSSGGEQAESSRSTLCFSLQINRPKVKYILDGGSAGPQLIISTLKCICIRNSKIKASDVLESTTAFHCRPLMYRGRRISKCKSNFAALLESYIHECQLYFRVAGWISALLSNLLNSYLGSLEKEVPPVATRQ